MSRKASPKAMTIGLSLLAVSLACLSWWFFKQIRQDYGYVTTWQAICYPDEPLMEVWRNGQMTLMPHIHYTVHYELGNYFGPAAFFKSIARGVCGIAFAALALYTLWRLAKEKGQTRHKRSDSGNEIIAMPKPPVLVEIINADRIATPTPSAAMRRSTALPPLVAPAHVQ